jgi:hypothetical protein
LPGHRGRASGHRKGEAADTGGIGPGNIACIKQHRGLVIRYAIAGLRGRLERAVRKDTCRDLSNAEGRRIRDSRSISAGYINCLVSKVLRSRKNRSGRERGRDTGAVGILV